MSVATEIARIQGAKADLKTAIEAKGVTVPSATTIDGYATLVAQISGGGGGFDLAGLKLGTKTTIAKADGDYLASFMSKANACNGLFNGTTTITSADYSGITTLSGQSCMQSIHQGNTGLTSVDFSNLASTTGGSVLRSAFSGCTGLTSIAFPSLASISGTYALYTTFQNCTSLASVSFPALATVPTASNSNWARQCFDGCTAITSATVHPATLKSSTQNLNLLGYVTASTFTDLSLSADATDNVYLSWAANLNSDSILNVLNHLSTSASSKTCAFNSLTVASSDTNYAAISAKVTALTNWTITGLTL